MFLQRHRLALVASLSALTLAFPALADLESVDLATSGDGLVTRDTQSGLDWLDLPLTAGQSVSYWLGNGCNGVPECPPGGWFESGWRMATTLEVCNLFNELDLNDDPLCPDPVETTANFSDLSILGYTCHNFESGLPQGIEAFFDDGPPDNLVGHALLLNVPIFGGLRLVHEEVFTWNYTGIVCNEALDKGYATFFVRESPAEPEPPAAVPSLLPKSAIFVAALLAIAAYSLIRRRPSRVRAR